MAKDLKIRRVLILVELDNNHVHQVLASKEQKDICIQLLRSDEGSVLLSERVEPITLEAYKEYERIEQQTPEC